MSFGEFYRRLVAYGPELIGRAEYYAAVKKAVEEATAEFNHYRKLKPEYRLEWLDLCTEKWFGNPTNQKTPILETPLTKPDEEGPPEHAGGHPPCYGDPFTQPECRLCYLVEKCCLEATHR